MGRATFSTRPDLFAEWTPEVRWLAGLLWADGFLFPGIGPNGDRITLNLADEEAIDQAAEIIGPGHKRGVQPARKATHRPLHRLVFWDTRSELWRLGFRLKPERAWPSELDSGEFLRGFFDGDGHVCQRPDVRKFCLRTTLCSPAPLLHGARDWLADQGIQPRDLEPHGRSWRLTWGHADSLRLAEIMYAAPGPRLTRKWAHFRRQGRL